MSRMEKFAWGSAVILVTAALLIPREVCADSLTFAHNAQSTAHETSDYSVRYDREAEALSAVVDVGRSTDNGDDRDRFRFAAAYRHDVPWHLYVGVTAEHSTVQQREFGVGKYKSGASSATAVLGRRWGDPERDTLRFRIEAGLGVLEAHGGPFGITDGCYGADCAGWWDGTEISLETADATDVYVDGAARYALNRGRGFAVAPIPSELATSYRVAFRVDYAAYEGVDAYVSAQRDAHLSGVDEVDRVEFGATARIAGRLNASARIVYERGVVGGLALHAPGSGWRRELGISYEL